MGRRFEKRRETFHRVVRHAADLFATRGYEATTVEEIAGAAGVSPGTVYNYFGTKGAILLAVVAERSGETLVPTSGSWPAGSADPVDQVTAVAMAYLDPILDLDRRLVAEVFGASFDPSRSLLLAEFAASDRRAIERLAEVVEELRVEGAVREDVDAGTAATLVFSIVAMATIAYLGDASVERGEVAPLIRANVALAFQGIGPRQHVPQRGTDSRRTRTAG